MNDSTHLPGEYVAALVVRRSIRATPERLFEAWTDPKHLVQWWGPEGVACPEAHVDLRPGGAYRIANRFPDGSLIWISGVFEIVERPNRLVYSWRLSVGAGAPERVSVTFTRTGAETEVVVTHERIPDEATKKQHEHGWHGCLDGLRLYLAA